MLFTTILALASLAVASPVQMTPTVVERNLESREVASVIVYARALNFDICLSANVGTPASNIGLLQARAKAILGNLASVTVCASVLANAVPSCDAGEPLALGRGCTFECKSGFRKTNNGCEPINVPSGSFTNSRKRSLSLAASRKAPCSQPEETACPLSGSILTSADIASHDYVCADLSSSLESCGACGNVCTEANAGCFEGKCVVMSWFKA